MNWFTVDPSVFEGNSNGLGYAHPLAVATTTTSHPAPLPLPTLSKAAAFDTVDPNRTPCTGDKGVQTTATTLGERSKTITVTNDYWIEEKRVQTSTSWDRVLTEGSKIISVTTSDDDILHTDDIDPSIDEGIQYLTKDKVLSPSKLDKNGYLRASDYKRNTPAGRAKTRKACNKRNPIGPRRKRRRLKFAHGTSNIQPPKQSERPKAKRRARRAVESVPAGQEFAELQVAHEQQRQLISHWFVQMLRCPPPEEWSGEDGTIAQIIRDLRLEGAQRREVKSVIERTYKKCLKGEDYV